MEATHWVEKKPKESEKKDDYEKAFDLLNIKTNKMKQKFRSLGKAVVENDQEAIDSVLNYLNENTSREISGEEIDGLKFVAEFSERGPQKMASHQLFERYFAKEPDFNHIQKVPLDIFHWRDSQNVNRTDKSKYIKPKNKGRGLCGKLS
jgi:hypothetical protein